MPREIKFNSGYNDCNDMIVILKNESVPRDLTNLEELDRETISNKDLVYVDSNGSGKQISLKDILNPENFKADWNAKEDEDGFIKNKPGVDNLEEDMIALHSIGGVKVGHRFERGTSLRDIVEAMFALGNTGYLTKFCSSIEPSELTDAQIAAYDTEANRVQISSDEFELGKTTSVSPKNEYFCLAIPKETGTASQVIIKEIIQAGFALEFDSYEAGAYLLYYYGPSYTADKFVITIKFGYEE